MADSNTPSDKGVLSPEEMQGWLTQEIRNSAKAHELRVREAAEFVDAYTKGAITSDEVMKRLSSYDQRWGEALPGVHAGDNITDEAIVKAVDAARAREQSDPGRFADSMLRRKRTDRPTESSL
jgi:hypothetical protein